MNRKDWEAQIFASKMNYRARMLCIAYGSFGNWNDDREIWPSQATIINMTGLNKNTVSKYTAALVEHGWLVPVRKLPQNVTVYNLSEPTTDELGCLGKSKRGFATTGQFPTVRTTDKDSVSYVTQSSILSNDSQYPTLREPVSHHTYTNIKEPKDMNLKEHKEEVNEDVSGSSTPGPDGPVDTNVIPLPLSTNTMKSSLSHQERETFFKNSRFTAKPVSERARQLILTKDFYPDLAESVRVNYAFDQANQEIYLGEQK